MPQTEDCMVSSSWLFGAAIIYPIVVASVLLCFPLHLLTLVFSLVVAPLHSVLIVGVSGVRFHRLAAIVYLLWIAIIEVALVALIAAAILAE